MAQVTVVRRRRRAANTESGPASSFVTEDSVDHLITEDGNQLITEEV